MTPTEPAADEGDPEDDATVEPLYQLGYVSTQTRKLNGADLVELLNVARESNRKLGVTGLLLHRQDSFFQLIEGPRDVITTLYARICSDPRHRRVEKLFTVPIDEREFADWQMAFMNLDDVDLSLLPAYSTFLTDDAEPRRFLQDLSRGKRLALMFREMP